MTAIGLAPAIELRERVAALLKKEPLFSHLGWRLLTDLVAVAGLATAVDGRTVFAIDFAALTVLEGTLIVSNEMARHTPLDSPVAPIMPPAGFRVELRPGLYLRTDPFFDPWNKLRIEAPTDQVLRFWVLAKSTFNAAPAQVLGALDPGGLPPGVPLDVLFHS